MPLEQRTETSTSTTSPERRTSCTISSWTVTGRAFELDLLAVAHPLVGALAVDLDRRDRGRHLLEVADELGGGRADDGLVEAGGRDGRGDLALGVVGGGGDAEPDRGVVRLLGQHQVAEQPGGPVDARGPARRSPSGRGCRRGRPCGCRPAGGPGPRRRATSCRRACRRRPARDSAGHSSSSSSTRSRRRRRRARAASCTGPRSPAYVSTRAGRDLVVERLGPGQHLVEVAGGLGQRVGDEGQRRGVPHAELLGDLGADQALGRLQRGRRVGERGLVVTGASSTV